MNKTFWPVLNYHSSKDTLSTLILYTQIVGKIRLKSMPWMNHSWHVTLYVSANGLTTGSMPYYNGLFEIQFNFIHHKLMIITSTGIIKEIELGALNVAQFYNSVFNTLHEAGIDLTIYATPNELETVIPFKEDIMHSIYNKEQVYNYWKALVKVHNVFTKFKTGFCGKCSPVHLFWGAFDLAVTRFSGRVAPLHSGGAPNMPLRVMQEAYSHEVSSCGFWRGNDKFPHAAFYSYCYPTPEAYGKQNVKPEKAFYDNTMGEFFLLYDDVIKAENPEKVLLEFLQTTYEAAADTGNWNRSALECDLTSFES